MNAIVDKQAAEVRTTCPYCGVGCGVLAKVAADGTVSVRGDPDHPANFGKLCSKGSALGETMAQDGRLLHPEIGRQRAEWNEALDLVAANSPGPSQSTVLTLWPSTSPGNCSPKTTTSPTS